LATVLSAPLAVRLSIILHVDLGKSGWDEDPGQNCGEQGFHLGRSISSVISHSTMCETSSRHFAINAAKRLMKRYAAMPSVSDR
jgi:hypothetical protein